MTVRRQGDKLEEVTKVRVVKRDREHLEAVSDELNLTLSEFARNSVLTLAECKELFALADELGMTTTECLKMLIEMACEKEELVLSNARRFGVARETRKQKRSTGAVRTIGQIIDDMDIGSSQAAANA